MLNNGISLESAFILRINRAIIQLPTFISILSVFCLMSSVPCVQKKKKPSPILVTLELQCTWNYYFRFCTLSLSAGKRKNLSYYLIMASSSTNEEVAQARACSLFCGGVDSESVVVVAQERGGRLGLPGTVVCRMKFSTQEPKHGVRFSSLSQDCSLDSWGWDSDQRLLLPLPSVGMCLRGGQDGLGMEHSMLWRDETWSCASRTAAHAYKNISASGLRARARSCCPALGKLCLVTGDPQVYISRDQMSYLYQCNIRQREWRRVLGKPGYILIARTEVWCGDQWAC